MISPEQRKGLRTWIEVDTEALRHNFSQMRKIVPPPVKIMAVVKSNAYGHSLVDFSRAIEQIGADPVVDFGIAQKARGKADAKIHYGADSLAVDSIVEGLRLRKEGIKLPILVIGYVLPEMLREAVSADIACSVSNFSELGAIAESELPKKLSCHVEIDTGLNRRGFLEKDISELISKLHELKDKISVDGLYTHFAQAKDADSREYTKQQIATFKKIVEIFHTEGFKPIIHASATPATFLYPEARFDMVRLGAALYGIWPKESMKQAVAKEISLIPILSWRTLIAEVKSLPKGAKVGYELTHTLSRDSKIAICPVGYWHGLSGALSNKGFVLVRGKKVPIIGRVSMDMVTIDVSDVPNIAMGDVVTLIGSDGKETIAANDLAALTNSGQYEVLCRLNPQMKRIYS